MLQFVITTCVNICYMCICVCAHVLLAECRGESISEVSSPISPWDPRINSGKCFFPTKNLEGTFII